MGSALYQGLKKGFSKHQLTIFDRHPEKLSALGVVDSPKTFSEFLSGIDYLIIAIKPQGFESWIEEVDADLSHLLILSVMAGISLDTLQKQTGSSRVIWLMPNLAVRESAGHTAWIATESTPEEDRKTVGEMLNALGTHQELTNEDQMHAISVTAGSGPAYFFHLTDRLAKETEALGFSPEESLALSKQVLIGAAKLLETSTNSPIEWRDNVTSKGGITAAALEQFQKHGFDEMLHEAIVAGVKRSKELS